MRHFLLMVALAATAAVTVAAPPKPVVIIVPDGKDANIKAVVKAGGTLEVRLASNPSTGYSWTASVAKPAVLKPAGERFVAPETGRVGAGGTQVFTFRALKPGQTGVVFRYARPWEKGAPPARSAQLEVTATK